MVSLMRVTSSSPTSTISGLAEVTKVFSYTVDIGQSFARILGRSACSIISLPRYSWMPLTKAKRALSCRQDPTKICMQHYIATEVFLDASYQS